MKQKKIPMRKCTGCGEMKPKRELIRVVKAPDLRNENGEVVEKGEVSLDLDGRKPGRGAYICPKPECLRAAAKSRRLEKAFSCRVPEEVYAALEASLANADGEETDHA